MPLIHGEVARLPNEVRSQLVDDLRRVVEDPSRPGPVIFEIPFAGPRYDVMVVWERWKGAQPDERAEIISEAYAGRAVAIAQAMGLTYEEATKDHLLPYQIEPHASEGEADPTELRNAMLEEGAISRSEKTVELGFPTSAMARAAHERLRKKVPSGSWKYVVETFVSDHLNLSESVSP